MQQAIVFFRMFAADNRSRLVVMERMAGIRLWAVLTLWSGFMLPLSAQVSFMVSGHCPNAMEKVWVDSSVNPYAVGRWLTIQIPLILFFTITHIPSLSLPSRFKTPFFCKAARSRSMVRWLTDKVSDICLPVIVGDSFIRLSIFC